MLTISDLMAFEKRVAEAFEEKRIRAPIHLAGGNEEHLIEIMKDVGANDWVLCQWRSHYHCLLKGVDPEQLFQDILDGHSITLCYPEHRILSSAIVGGHLPIAVGIAWSIKQKKGNEHVWAFLGDMTAEGEAACMAISYAARHDLPIKFIVEDNGKSVDTPTIAAWGERSLPPWGQVIHYGYCLQWTHSGIGEAGSPRRIEF